MSKKKQSKTTKIHFNPLDWFCFFIIFIISLLIVFFYHENPPFYTFMSIIALDCGVIGMILNVKGHRFYYLFAFIESFACFYTSWTQRFVGNALINLLFYAPITLVGFHSWSKHSDKNQRVVARKFTVRQAIIALVIFITTTLLLNFILIILGGTFTLLDSAATIFVIFATTLSVLRFREQWIFWFLSDILQFIMWTTTNDPAILTLRFFFPLSAIYGYINWNKLIKKRKNRHRTKT